MSRDEETPSDPQPDVEFVLFVVLASDEPVVIEAVSRALDYLGIETHVAKPEAGPAIIFDYEKARYVPIALSGTLPPSDSVEITERQPAKRAWPGLKAMLFPNSPVVGDAEFFHIELDPGGMWITRFVEALDYLGLVD